MRKPRATPNNQNNLQHGLSFLPNGNGRKTPTYISWQSMKTRCTNPNHDTYRFYGAKGVRIHEKFMTFQGFLSVVGLRPPGMTLDRINANGDYEPGNVRWADSRTQRLNRRTQQ